MPTKLTTCPNCEGSGQELLQRSWFVADGYRKSKCGDCSGSGEVPVGHQMWPGHAEFLRIAHERIATWGGLKPALPTT